MKKSKIQILNTFFLKILAAIFMTLDHIGLFLISYTTIAAGKTIFDYPMSFTGYVFRCIGRIALPIFAMLFAEAMVHSKSREKYMSKLGLMCVLVLVTEIVSSICFNKNFGSNIFLTLLCSASFIYFFEKKDNKRFLCAIPLLYILLSFASLVKFKISGSTLMPLYLMADYDLYGFILCVGFYMCYKLSDARVLSLCEEHGESRNIEELRTFPYYRTFTNIIWVLFLLVVNVFFWLIQIINSNLDFYNIGIQSYAIFAGLFLFMYNGEKGYRKKRYQISFYAYYPLHLIILFIIFYVTFGH